MFVRGSRARRVCRFVIAAVAIVVATFPFTACRVPAMPTVLIEDYDTASIRGLQLWMQISASGDHVESIRLEFDETHLDSGGETLVFSVWNSDREIESGVPTVVERDAAVPDRVVIRPILSSLGRGIYRVSSFNDAGSSALSAERFVH